MTDWRAGMKAVCVYDKWQCACGCGRRRVKGLPAFYRNDFTAIASARLSKPTPTYPSSRACWTGRASRRGRTNRHDVH
jgi:hypothetical protein